MVKNTIITKYNSPNYTPNARVKAVYGYPRTIDYITIHWWGDPKNNPSFEGIISWLSQPRSQVSAHDVVTGTGARVAIMVNNANAAWHTGNAKGNASTLGFELDPRCREVDYQAAAQDIADTWKYYGRKIPLKPHNHWSSTQCPGKYNLTKLYNMASEIYSGKSKPKETPKPTPAVKLVKKSSFNPAKKFKIKTATTLVNIPVNTKYSGSATYKVGAIVDNVVELLEYSNGKKFYRTEYARDTAKKYYGFEANKLTEIVPETPKPEWIKNLKDITDTKLTVLPAEGVPVVNLETLKPLESTIIPKGTQVDIAMETVVKGKKYYISSYSVKHNISNGILASSLGVPEKPKPIEKPEWLDNLEDIEDMYFWTRSETPLLNLENGTIITNLPINTRVLITHSTRILDIDLMVIDGMKAGIETVYLSDNPIEEPNKDLEERVNILEKLVKNITDFLSSIFKNFTK